MDRLLVETTNLRPTVRTALPLRVAFSIASKEHRSGVGQQSSQRADSERIYPVLEIAT